MKIKEVTAGVKLTSDYNSYQISLTADLEVGEEPEIMALHLLDKSIKIAQKKAGLKAETKEDIPKVEKKMEGDGSVWKQHTCGKNCKRGYMKDHPDSFYCGACKQQFD